MISEDKNEDLEDIPSEIRIVKPSRKKTEGIIRSGLFFLSSFALVFFMMWLYVNQFERPRRLKMQKKKSLKTVTSQADSVMVSLEDSEEPIPDSAMAMFGVKGEKLEKMELVEYISMLKDQLVAKQNRIDELSAEVKEKKKLTNEVTRLKDENVEKQKELEFAKKTLPDNVVNKLSEQQMLGTSQPIQVQRSGTTGDRLGTSIVSARTGDVDRNENVRKLAKIYEAMRPEEAAPILIKLDDDKVIEILLRMRQREAARLLTNFNPDRAARISKLIGEKK